MTEKKFIYFTVDSKYLRHLAVALMSFIDHHEISEFDFGLIYRDIDDQEMDKFLKFFSSLGLQICCVKVDHFLDEIKVGYHFNQIIFYRFLGPELFPNKSKILYLDSDLIFLDDISSLFDVDLDAKVLAAIDKTKFTGVPKHLQKFISRYFASGLLLINSLNFVDKSIKLLCVDFLKSHYYEMPDQDALSFVVQDFVAIDPSYGVETDFLFRHGQDFEFTKFPKIIQFSGSSKPWHMNNSNPYKKLYWAYRSQTPYKSFFPDDFGLVNLIKFFIPASLKNSFKCKRSV